MSGLKYFAAFVLPIVTFSALWWPEYLAFAGVVYSFGFIPLVETILPPIRTNHSEESEPSLLSNRLYDWLLYATVPIQWALLGLFLYRVTWDALPVWQVIGMTGSMGMCCGILGINVGHELGHRVSRFERFLTRMLLLSSLYLHFTIEHNRGHHRWVATDKDPATARRNETLYQFWARCIPGVFASAWNLSCNEARNRGRSVWGPSNEVLRLLVIEFAFVASIGFLLGPAPLLCSWEQH